jgi:hypothetical protein
MGPGGYTGPDAKQGESTPFTPHYLKIHFSIIFSYMLRLSSRNFVHVYLLFPSRGSSLSYLLFILLLLYK